MGTVYGVGTNDAGYAIQVMESVRGANGKPKQRIIWFCPFYRRWVHMLERCYSERYQEKKPTYIGCTVCEEWLRFSNFKSWMETQDWEGKHLDKDLLVEGNKIYSPDTCIFVTNVVNTFLTDSKAIRGDWPIGVQWHKKNRKFMARCSNPFTSRQEYLGYFSCPIEAHIAWLTRKTELVRLLASEQSDPRITKALLNKFENYTMEEL